jgi:cytoskeletal protein CcmA (bactofilin family)
MAANPSDTIGKSTKIRGEVTGKDALTIQGVVEGEIRLTNLLTVAPEGVVDATVHATAVSVEGRLQGSIEAEQQVVLRAGCEVRGEVRAPQVVIEGDARFDGTLLMNVELPDGLLDG